MMWSCCNTPRKSTFKFEYGTVVKASDFFRAIELLRSISLKNVTDVEYIDGNNWIIKFHPNVSIQIEALDQARARRAAEWLVYLDRREERLRCSRP